MPEIVDFEIIDTARALVLFRRARICIGSKGTCRKFDLAAQGLPQPYSGNSLEDRDVISPGRSGLIDDLALQILGQELRSDPQGSSSGNALHGRNPS